MKKDQKFSSRHINVYIKMPRDHVRDVCACGCGNILPPDRWGYPKKFIHGHNTRGMKWPGTHPNQRGVTHSQYRPEPRVNGTGYVVVRVDGHPRASKHGSYVPIHVLVMEKHLGRYLTKSEHIHHINGNSKDNRLENLRIVTNSEHSRLHRLLEKSMGKKFFGK